MTPECLTLAETATALKVKPHHVKDLVATTKVRCGIFVPGWYGQASILHRGEGLYWKGSVVDVDVVDSRRKTWHYRCVQTGEEYTVTSTLISQFWYLHHSTAYLLALAGSDGVDCEWLEPVETASLHGERPDSYPWPDDFIFDVETEQTRSRRITWENIRFRRQDVEALTRERKILAREPVSVTPDWQEVAKAIAVRFWAHDRELGFERKLKVYAELVEKEMCERDIQAPHGLPNAKYIQRQALGGILWWANRKK